MRRTATVAYAIYSAGDGFLFRMISTIYSIFVVLTLHLEPLQLLLLGTILEGTYLICEIPTGVVADTISRRLSVVIGLVGSGLAFIVPRRGRLVRDRRRLAAAVGHLRLVPERR
jgi:MFS transporter, DHA3 family, tetracycline resistance protein